ncbi:hypothetical protein ACP275_13G013400 [Erythranthe tilingii]
MPIFLTTSFDSILLSIIILISISPLPSIGHKITVLEIKKLCSKTSNPDNCYKLLKSDHRTINIDEKGLVQVSIDLASKVANKIHFELESEAKATNDSRSKNVYNVCSKSYNNIIRDLRLSKNNLKSGVARVKNISEEIERCKKAFSGASARIKKTNEAAFGFVLSIVRIMLDNFVKRY